MFLVHNNKFDKLVLRYFPITWTQGINRHIYFKINNMVCSNSYISVRTLKFIMRQTTITKICQLAVTLQQCDVLNSKRYNIKCNRKIKSVIYILLKYAYILLSFRDEYFIIT